MISLKDAYYYEYEINNHNLLVVGATDEEMDICLINQVLPLQYQLEYGPFIS